jgi:hypothetical protein
MLALRARSAPLAQRARVFDVSVSSSRQLETDYEIIDDKLKSGMYSDSSSAAMMIPIITSSTGSTIVMNRVRLVSISSS